MKPAFISSQPSISPFMWARYSFNVLFKFEFQNRVKLKLVFKRLFEKNFFLKSWSHYLFLSPIHYWFKSKMSRNFCFAFICGKSIKTETSFHQKFNFIIALVLCLNSFVFSEEFCKAFRDNGHQISYTFQIEDELMVVIDGKYWILEIKENEGFNGSDKYRAILQSTQSKECNLFSAEYSMATFIRITRPVRKPSILLFKVTIIW